MSEADILVTPIRIQSRNVLDKLHWAAKGRMKQEYALLIRNQITRKKVSKAKKKKYKLIILSYRKRKLDYDNLVGGCKQLIDALIQEGFIFDDSPDYIDLKVQQFTAKEYQTIIIRK